MVAWTSTIESKLRLSLGYWTLNAPKSTRPPLTFIVALNSPCSRGARSLARGPCIPTSILGRRYPATFGERLFPVWLLYGQVSCSQKDSQIGGDKIGKYEHRKNAFTSTAYLFEKTKSHFLPKMIRFFVLVVHGLLKNRQKS